MSTLDVLHLAPEGVHVHWFNDAAGRVERARHAGWSHVRNADGSDVVRNVAGVGQQPMWAFAMWAPADRWKQMRVAI